MVRLLYRDQQTNRPLKFFSPNIFVIILFNSAKNKRIEQHEILLQVEKIYRMQHKWLFWIAETTLEPGLKNR